MDAPRWLAELNPSQQRAVTALGGPILVLAGPGSGKTRVLVHRIAYLIQTVGVSPGRILAVTFTNKAAREMEARLAGLLGPHLVRPLWTGTFHALCARILRRDGEAVGVPRTFVIYDEDDQRALVRQALKELNLDPKQFNARALLSGISRIKTAGLSPREARARAGNYWEEVVARVYELYQEGLRRNQALDFDDLLLRAVALLEEQEPVRERYQERFLHVLVDEFQDTNPIQYDLTRLLVGKHRNLFAVGDADQSIYAFRGATVENVFRLREDFPDLQILPLEENYRSYTPILRAAEAVMAASPRRLERPPLRAVRGDGPPVVLWEPYTEHEEAQWVVREILHLQEREGYAFRDFAVLFRTNAQSRLFEEALRRAGVPYRMVGGVRFYDRKEIRDLLAYLRLAVHPNDRLSFERAVAVPRRGVGPRTLQALYAWADREGLSLYDALARVAAGEHPLSGPGVRGLKAFFRLWEGMRTRAREEGPLQAFDFLLAESGYEAYLRDGSDEGEERWENVRELRRVLAEHSGDLASFLETVSLTSRAEGSEGEEEGVSLITLHAAKGLEFPVVFLVGVEEGYLPHARSAEEPAAVEEERRLLYVGMTRAKDRLYLSHCLRRTVYGYVQPQEPSRFLAALPQDRRWVLRVPGPGLAPAGADAGKGALEGRAMPRPGPRPERRPAPAAEGEGFRVGDRVHHPLFGEGVVLEARATGGDWFLRVRFREAGEKRLLAKFAKLTVLERSG